jgi:hypothetical protein
MKGKRTQNSIKNIPCTRLRFDVICKQWLLDWKDTLPPPCFESPSGPRRPHCWGFDVTLRYTALGSIRVIGPSQRPLTKRNTHTRQTTISSAGLEPAIPVTQRPKTQELDRTAAGIGGRINGPQHPSECGRDRRNPESTEAQPYVELNLSIWS